MQSQTAINQSINQASSSLRNRSTHADGGPVKDPKVLNKQDFLNLMMTQMANQDPLDPMDSNQMMQQMAALGTVEQLQNVNMKLDQMVVGQNDLIRSNAFSFLGKDIEIGSKTLKISGGIVAPASYSLEWPADVVNVHIINGEGDAVRVIKLDDQSKGDHHFSWDGTDNDGDSLSDGIYQYKVLANTEDGEKINVEQFKKGRVSNVTFENGRPMAVVNGEYFPIGEVKGVNKRSESRFDNAVPLPLKKEISPKSPILKAGPPVDQ